MAGRVTGGGLVSAARREQELVVKLKRHLGNTNALEVHDTSRRRQIVNSMKSGPSGGAGMTVSRKRREAWTMTAPGASEPLPVRAMSGQSG